MFSFLRKQNGKTGFTLIELLVVIAIIGILAAIVLVSLNTARRRGRDAKRLGDLASLTAALELYADTNLYYPMPNPVNADPYTNFANMGGDLQATGFLATLARDPVNAINQRYGYAGTNSSVSPPTFIGGAGCSPPSGIAYVMRAGLEGDAISAARDGDCASYVSTTTPAVTIACNAAVVGNYQYCLFQVQ